jgi:prepilin-type N-terminal cleavage/methylation domain-containing protein
MRASRGFTLVELAVAVTIFALILSTALYTFSAQVDQRDFAETQQRLERARELVLAFAMVNGRLPCPGRYKDASNHSNGAEVRVADNDAVTAERGKCKDTASTGVEDYYGGTLTGAYAGYTGGLLPAQSIGFRPVDSAGFAIDAYGNRIRYAVAKTLAGSTCSGTNTLPHFTYKTNLQANGMSCQPGDLIICKSSTSITGSACGGAANQINAQSLVVAIIFSTGKNGSTGGTGNDEAANLNGGGNSNPVFVWHTPNDSTSSNGEFDDQFVWIPVGEFYGKLVSSGMLP